MDEHFYVRIRGRVQGPYEVDKLRSLVRRGQLSRMHEVSNDKVVWKQAADFPELFSSPEVRTAANNSAEHRQAAESADVGVMDRDEPPAQDSKEWYYAKNNVQNGPVTFDHLRALTQAGAVVGEDLVWKEGMTEWKPAWQIQGLHTIPLMTGTGSKSLNANDGSSTDLVRTMSDSRAWAGFVSACINICGVLCVILSVIAFLYGVRRGNTADTAGGLFGLLWSSLVVTAGVLLSRYNRNVRRYVANGASQELDDALRSLRSIWIFAAIVLIVFLVNLIAVAIWVFAAGIVSLH